MLWSHLTEVLGQSLAAGTTCTPGLIGNGRVRSCGCCASVQLPFFTVRVKDHPANMGGYLLPVLPNLPGKSWPFKTSKSMKNTAPSTQLFKFKIILLKRGKSCIIYLFPVAALTKTNNIAITSVKMNLQLGLL